MSDRSPNENLIQKLAAGKLFRIVALAQFCIHLCAYIASFVKLITIEAGGYYDVGVWAFIRISFGSIPLFAIGAWLIRHSLKISKNQRFWGYCFQIIVLNWNNSIVKLSYFR